jgi:hypothetical protein
MPKLNRLLDNINYYGGLWSFLVFIIIVISYMPSLIHHFSVELIHNLLIFIMQFVKDYQTILASFITLIFTVFLFSKFKNKY